MKRTDNIDRSCLYRPRRRPEDAAPRAGATFLWVGLAALVVSCGYGEAARAASKLQVLYSFTNIRGAGPYGGLIADGAGNLYGSTLQGGANNDGVVFELSPPAGDKKHWTENVLESFNGTNGNGPNGNLIADGAGNLYGATNSGGADNDGVVFELSPPKAGKKAWKETVLLSFDETNGANPNGSLIADGAGNFFGTTTASSGSGRGVVFELSPPKKGATAWTETVLYDFTGLDGNQPYAGVIADGAGNLYGTTTAGGSQVSDGAVFELSPPAKGQTAWTETVLHAFSGLDGYEPYGGLVADGAGDLYGTTFTGGTSNDGVIFKLSPPSGGQTAWTETVLHSFNGANGAEPYASLIADGAGNLYSTTISGGADGDGVVFELSPPAKGQTTWTETVLQSFNGTNGEEPLEDLITDGAGNLYGTTFAGGAQGDGVVFKLKP